jgi:thioredoxin reductase
LRGLPGRAVARALLLSRWSSDLLLFTDGDEIEPEKLDRLTAAGVRVRIERVARVRPGDSGVDVVMTSGAAVPRRTVFVVTRQHQQSDLAARLGCRLTDAGPLAGAVETDGSGRTSVPGVWAAGTTTVPTLLAIGAAGHASGVAMAVHSALLEQDITAAL